MLLFLIYLNSILYIVENATQYVESETARTAFLADGYRLQMNVQDDKIYCLKGDQSGKSRERSRETCW